jgi:hypothetical protein
MTSTAISRRCPGLPKRGRESLQQKHPTQLGRSTLPASLAEDEAVVAVATGQAAERPEQKDGKDNELEQTGPLRGLQFDAVAARAVTHCPLRFFF